MATMTLAIYRSQIRSNINESTAGILSDAELNTLVNDGYKDICVKTLCYESKIAKDNILASENLISLVGLNIVKVRYVEYSTSPKGMLAVLPTTIGHNNHSGTAPKNWFQWGNYLYVEPVPDVATYDLSLFAACYPAAVMSADGDTPANVPEEYHEDILLFATAFANLKLKRWGDAVHFYNRYLANIRRKGRRDTVDPRALKEIPDNVTEAKNG